MFLQLLRGHNFDEINIETAKNIAKWIKRIYPSITIYITGSVLRPELIHSGSDIDFVIMGIKEEEYDTLIKTVYSKFRCLKIDIRRMEELDFYIRQKIIKKGLML